MTEIFDDPRLFTMLCSQERALHIAEKIEEYSVDQKESKRTRFLQQERGSRSSFKRAQRFRISHVGIERKGLGQGTRPKPFSG